MKIIVPGYAQPWKRQGAAGKFRWTDSKKMAAHKGLIILEARNATKDTKPLTGAVWLSVTIFRAIPKAFGKKKRSLAIEGIELPTTRPDLDNQIKLIKDALTGSGVCWVDDSQVCRLDALKRYGEIERTEIIVTEI